jgi:hypothetical protein
MSRLEPCGGNKNCNSHDVFKRSSEKHEHFSFLRSDGYNDDASSTDHGDDHNESSIQIVQEPPSKYSSVDTKIRPFVDNLESNIYSTAKIKRRRTSLDILRNPSPRLPSLSGFSPYDNEVDAQLADELIGYASPTPSEVESIPIPLLTPPASPVPIKSDESIVEIYEWPSNLAVDNALTAASKLNPLSLSSLAKLEEINDCREPFIIVFPRKARRVIS